MSLKAPLENPRDVKFMPFDFEDFESDLMIFVELVGHLSESVKFPMIFISFK